MLIDCGFGFDDQSLVTEQNRLTLVSICLYYHIYFYHYHFECFCGFDFEANRVGALGNMLQFVIFYAFYSANNNRKNIRIFDCSLLKCWIRLD